MSGTAQFAYQLVEPAGHRPPRARDRFTATSTAIPGQAPASVAPGETVYFNRTTALDQRAPDGILNPPEGASGEAYHVKARTPATVRVVMPSAGAAYHRGLSEAERWLLGQLNARRREHGAAPLASSTTLDRAARAQARDEALHHRWPDPYFYVVNQSFGWPGTRPTRPSPRPMRPTPTPRACSSTGTETAVTASHRASGVR